MKHFVMVNGKFMTTVDADSCAAAEHMILDNIPGTQSALAFDADGMTTETFRGCLLSCELVSQVDLVSRFDNRRDANESYKQARADVALADIRLQDARAEVQAAEAALAKAKALAESAFDVLKHYNEELNIDTNYHVSDF